MSDINIVIAAQVGDATAGLRQVQDQVKRVDQQMKSSVNTVNQYANAHNRSATSLKKFSSGVLQQAGYQVGDFAVQVANGTSKMQAFGQQGSQLLGIFGPWGAVLGAVVAVVSAVAVAAEKTTKVIKENRTAVERLSDAFSALESIDFSAAMGKAARSVDPVISKYTGLLTLIERVGEEQRALAFADIVKEFAPTEKLEEYKSKLNEIRFIINNAISRGLKFNSEELQFALQMQDKYQAKLNAEINLRNILAGIQGKTREEAALNLSRTVAFLETLGLMTPELRLQLNIFAEQAGLVGVIKNEVNGAVENTQEMAKAAESARQEFEKAAAAVMNINVNAAAALAGMNAKLRSFQRGLSIDQVRIMEAGRKAEIAAREAGVDSAVELAAIGAEASSIERKIIAAEGALKSFTDTATGSSAASAIKANIFDPFKKMGEELDAIMGGIAQTMESALTSGFMSIVDGTKSAKDAFRDMARSIIAELYKVLVVQQLVGSWDREKGKGRGLVGMIMGALAGARASGGPMTAGKSYLVGEKGPELVVPSRNSSVVPNSALGGGGVTVNQNITFGSGVSRAGIQQMLPKIVETTKAAVFDAQRRSVSGMGYA